MIYDKIIVFRIFHIGLRVQLLSLSHSPRSTACQIFSYSLDASRPYDSGIFHNYNLQFLVPNRKDNKNIELVNPFRTIRSTPRYLFHWINVFEEFSQHGSKTFVCFKSSCRSPWSGWHSILLINLRTRSCSASCTSEWGNPWMRKSKTRLPVPSWSISSSFSWTTSKFYWSSSARLFSVTGLSVLSNRLGWLGCSLLLSNGCGKTGHPVPSGALWTKSLRQLDLSIIVGARRGDFVLVYNLSSVVLDTTLSMQVAGTVLWSMIAFDRVWKNCSLHVLSTTKFCPNTPHPE